MQRSVVRGVGAYLPARRVSNEELSRTVDTTDEWIVQRTGIRARHIAAEGERTSDLGTEAARRALAMAGMEAETIDLIVLATSTPDLTFPATATTVQANLGIAGGAAFDVQAVCTGFVYALSVADSMIRGGMARRALVIGAETFSRIVDWQDRATCVLFGDGAGAIVLEGADGEGTTADRGVLAARLRSDGRHRAKLYVDSGPSTGAQVGHLRMDGKEVFKLAVGMVPQILHDTLADVGIGMDAIDWFVPHQANQRIIHATAEKLGIHDSKVVLTVGEHANTSAASVPMALEAAVRDGRIRQGHLVLLEAMGGGFTWGAALLRW